MFTAPHLFLGVVAALIIGLSKTAVPGGGLLATPLLAIVVRGRMIAGITIPILLLADVFAVVMYGRHARADVLRPLIAPVLAGFALGTAFYAIVGSGGRVLDVMLGVTILAMVVLQAVRMRRNSAPAPATRTVATAVGVTGGFTTFVSNAAGPVMNTYLTGIGLSKEVLVGTSAWFYFSVNLAKVPVYLALGAWVHGGAFFTADSLRFDMMVAPAVVVGVLVGRVLLRHLSAASFTIAVLVLAAFAAVKLLLGL